MKPDMKQPYFRRIASFITLGLLTLAAGCASVAVSDDAIERNTATAIGSEVGSFAITDRIDEGIKSSYTVKTSSGKKYSCYVTGTVSVVGRVVSDAVCTEFGKAAKQTPATNTASCNALLRAAGKCK